MIVERGAEIRFAAPDWSVTGVGMASTLRVGGVSRPPFDTLNLGAHVGDRAADVARNRELLKRALKLPGDPCWLEQVHGVDVAIDPSPDSVPVADAAVTAIPGRILAVLTADCLPVVLCTEAGDAVGIAHAGWRGLAAGILDNTLGAMPGPPDRLRAWLGPAIGPAAFEVGAEVRTAFADRDAGTLEHFVAGGSGRYFADLYGLARRRLHRLGVRAVDGGGECTHADRRRYFSYRRDGRCGRMATLVWLAPDG